MSLPSVARSTIKRLFRLVGWRARSIPRSKLGAVDLRYTINHPETLLYYGERTAPSILLEAPIQKGYSAEAFTLSHNGCHPFIQAIRHAEDAREPKNAIRWVLSTYYHHVQPDNAAQWLGLLEEDVPALADQPPWARLFPWQNDTVERRRRGHRNKMRTENRRYGEALPVRHGWKLCGPVDNAFLKIQVDRLLSVYRSIKSRGLQRHNDIDGDIRAIVLVDDGEWKWLQCGGGFHRVAVCAALGFETVPVRIWRVVFRHHVDLWPQVAAGTFSPATALEVFDRIFAGLSPSVVCGWRAELDAAKAIGDP